MRRVIFECDRGTDILLQYNNDKHDNHMQGEKITVVLDTMNYCNMKIWLFFKNTYVSSYLLLFNIKVKFYLLCVRVMIKVCYDSMKVANGDLQIEY